MLPVNRARKAIRALLARMVPLGRRVSRGNKDRSVRGAHTVNTANRDTQVMSECTVTGAKWVSKGSAVIQDGWAARARQATPVRMVDEELQGQMDWMDSKATRVHKVRPARTADLEFKEKAASLEKLAKSECRARSVQRARWASPASLDRMASLVDRAQMEHLALMVCAALKESMAARARMGKTDLRDCPARLAKLEKTGWLVGAIMLR